jgi:hypothetical protein
LGNTQKIQWSHQVSQQTSEVQLTFGEFYYSG